MGKDGTNALNSFLSVTIPDNDVREWPYTWKGSGSAEAQDTNDLFAYPGLTSSNCFRALPKANGYAPPPYVDIVVRIYTNETALPFSIIR